MEIFGLFSAIAAAGSNGSSVLIRTRSDESYNKNLAERFFITCASSLSVNKKRSLLLKNQFKCYFKMFNFFLREDRIMNNVH